MSANLQVSQNGKSTFGSRDVSARATHLKAAIEKVSVTTIERKIMSTKTTFKRIALVAVASLGLGLISTVPAKALYTVTPTLTLTTGTATKAKSDSTTAASISVAWTTDAGAADNRDTITVTATPISFPGATTPRLNLMFSDTTGTTGGALKSPYNTSNPGTTRITPYGGAVATDSVSATATSGAVLGDGSTTGYHVMKLLAFLDTTIARQVGTYSFTVTLTQSGTQYGAGSKNTATPISGTLTITVAALDSESTTASAAQSVAYLSTSGTSAPTTDASLSVLATSSTTARGYLYVNLKNASGAQAAESVTVTTTIGNLGANGDGAAIGKNVTLQYVSGGVYYPIYADGTAGTATITVKSASVTFSSKSVIFYSAVPSTLVASVLNSVPGAGATTAAAIAVTPKDSAGNLWAGSLAIYSDTLGVISDTGTACVSYITTLGVQICPVTGVAAGTAKVTVRNSTLAVVSNEVSLTVSAGTANSVALAWDKASYAPGEKATLSVTVLDSTGKAVPTATFANLFATGGITLSSAAGNGSDTLTAVSVTTTTPAADGTGSATTPQKLYTVYMPSSGATLVATATGGTSLPLASQVKVTATATVSDSGATALAAVTALASQVSAFITKINAQITTLTDLVMKIQKKVKA